MTALSQIPGTTQRLLRLVNYNMFFQEPSKMSGREKDDIAGLAPTVPTSTQLQTAPLFREGRQFSVEISAGDECLRLRLYRYSFRPLVSPSSVGLLPLALGLRHAIVHEPVAASDGGLRIALPGLGGATDPRPWR